MAAGAERFRIKTIRGAKFRVNNADRVLNQAAGMIAGQVPAATHDPCTGG
jgi:hypothetical protein